MARKRATMREGPLAELFRKTEAAQRSQGEAQPADAPAPEEDPRAQAALDETVEHVPDFVREPPVHPPVAEAAPAGVPDEEEDLPAEAAASRAAALPSRADGSAETPDVLTPWTMTREPDEPFLPPPVELVR